MSTPESKPAGPRAAAAPRRGWTRADTLLVLLVLGLSVPRVALAIWEMHGDQVSRGVFGPLVPPARDGEDWLLVPLAPGRGAAAGAEGFRSAEREAASRGFAAGGWESARVLGRPALVELNDGSALLMLTRVGRLCKVWDPARGEVALFCPTLRPRVSGRIKPLRRRHAAGGSK